MNLPAAEIEGLKEMFQAMDKDGSGTITAEEMREALKQKVGGRCGGVLLFWVRSVVFWRGPCSFLLTRSPTTAHNCHKQAVARPLLTPSPPHRFTPPPNKKIKTRAPASPRRTWPS
jgi:hypothetical protein